MATGSPFHNIFDAAIYLGVCDKIVPGLVIAAATFGYLPGIFHQLDQCHRVFLTMKKPVQNLQPARSAKNLYAPKWPATIHLVPAHFMVPQIQSDADGGCGLHLPGTSSSIRVQRCRPDRLGVEQLLRLTALGNAYRPVFDILDEKPL